MKTLIERLAIRRKLILAFAAAVGLAACATPPPELEEARTTYEQVAQGPASEYAPAELQTAKENLDDAEEAFKKDGDSEITRVLAYRATRHAQIADISASTYQARKSKEEAEQQLLAESEQAREERQAQLEATRASLQSAEENLKRAREDGSMTEQQLQQKRDELQQKQEALALKEQQLAVTQTELKSERERRAEAEKRLAEARKKLDEFAKVEEDAERIVITLTGEVLFAVDESELRQNAKARLTQVAEVLLADRDRQVVVEGHTDSQGKAAYNEKLSQDRADSVRTYLVSQGIASDRVEAIGKGETDPVSTNDTPEGRAMNRRVEIIIDKRAQQASR